MKLKKILKLFDYRISEGGQFLWKCFGDNVWTLDFNSPDDYRNGVSVTYDTVTTKVYYLSFSCAVGDTSYIWVDPDYEVAYGKERKARNIESTDCQCYSKESFLTMALDAYKGKTPDFDLSLDVDLNLDQDDYQVLLIMAKQRGMTFDELVNEVFEDALYDLKTKAED
jgi:hypothetical protein